MTNTKHQINKNFDNEFIETQIAERHQALKSGDIKRANELKRGLLRLNVKLDDTRHGTRWTIDSSVNTEKTAVFKLGAKVLFITACQFAAMWTLCKITEKRCCIK
ncbi:MAG: hypothetical protein M3388_01960 [Acidobacteriota bacterium]|nr:hypothetical protein [Acidobacteriota bacterium]